jgi:ribosomal protein L44E
MIKDKREIIAYCPFCKTTTQQEVEYNDKGEKRIVCSRCKNFIQRK